MAELLTPGVYYERVDATSPAIGVVRMDIAGFVGIAPRGPLDTPVPVESWRQYEAHFGGFTGSAYLAYAVRAFFENGGRRCWVVRVASKDPGGASAAERLVGSAAREVWRIAASSPGSWGGQLTVSVRQTSRAQTRSAPGPGVAEYSVVGSTAGFERGTLARISQPPLADRLRVVSDVDAGTRRLIWVNQDRDARLPYETPLEGLDPNQTALIESIEYTITVWESGRPTALYDGITLIPEHSRYGPTVLGRETEPLKLARQGRLPSPPRPIVLEELRQDYLDGIPGSLDLLEGAPDPVVLMGGADGLATLSPYEYVGEAVSPGASDVEKALKLRGLRTLEEVEEVASLAAPDVHIQPVSTPLFLPPPPCVPDPCLPGPGPGPVPALPGTAMELPPVFTDQQIYAVQSAMVEQCEALGDRVAVIDPTANSALDARSGEAAAIEWRTRFDSRYATFYFPWVRVVDPLRASGGATRAIPPSGFALGQWAAADFKTGVHRAPANEPLAWAQDVTAAVDAARHGLLNERGINAIRTQPGRGIRILGARTVSSDPDWVFLNVRRLMIMIRKSVYEAVQWAVMEPNEFRAQAKLRLAASSFLLALWERGALAGEAAAEAFIVRCDESNNPPSERDNGRLLMEIGVAPVKPFEFVVVRVGRTGNEFEIEEEGVSRGGM